jgi:hypothetical protein
VQQERARPDQPDQSDRAGWAGWRGRMEAVRPAAALALALVMATLLMLG